MDDIEKEIKESCICHIHDYIYDSLWDILWKIQSYESYRDTNHADDLIFEIYSEIPGIVQKVEIAIEKGQRMEDRLRLYKETIESLGFERKK